jgi:cell division protein FtsB
VDKVFESIGAFLSAVGPAGYPTSFLGGLLMLFYYLRKSEAGLRTELVSSLQRLQNDKAALQLRIDALQKELDAREADIDRLRAANRDLEDKAYNESRRADDNLEKLRKLIRSTESN